MMTILENIREITLAVFIISSVIYRRQLRLAKWQRKLTKGELIMYLILSITIPVFLLSYLIEFLGDAA